MAHKEGPQEPSDVRARDAGAFAAGLLLAVALVCSGTRWYLGALGGSAGAREPSRQPPEPRLQRDENDPREAEELYRAQEQLLGSYGWVDRRRGVVRVPVERAMELYLRRSGGKR